jgi:hypothetical protein
MTRSFFFILFFPPALMILMLVQMQPAELVKYLLAAYLIAAFPAAVLAFVDEIFAAANDATRATWCGLLGLLLSPLAMAVFVDMDARRGAMAAACGAIAAFLCSVAFARLDGPKRAPVSGVAGSGGVKPDASSSTPPDLAPQPAA